MIERIDIGAYEVQSAPVVDGDFNNDGTSIVSTSTTWLARLLLEHTIQRMT